ncbi:phosphonate ABC transporter ATP-binding protein [Prauserella muralis]|uniref:Phosphonate ABC transporter ATP-binding protein n=1 Tax=Prauserella muralis TaxID=588067 RepID=A0A2V4AM12_9PSEU|nr:phosphonate ABC transporter ATP-binding protein [Prauserella muralis]PXY21338.1 phosphonate ABC transporter ATP-binding protein [Prauserella muralis]TWE30465.1 phosphonate transport system ATP-binding protein [Prauserella muralis]
MRGRRSAIPTAAEEPGRYAVEMRGVHKAFGAVTVLDDVDLAVRRGEFVGLVGPSGAGKSTLLRLVNGMHTVERGSVRTLGTDPATCSRRGLRALRTKVGFAFQQFGLVGRLSAMENVLMGALATLRWPRYGVMSYPRALRVAALENLDRVGMADQRFQRCDTLSGGQQQRVAVARTLMQGPQLILADEPVASLDPASSALVLDILRRISREDDISVLCSLHQVELALANADRIVALRAGRVVLDEAADTLTADRLRTVYGTGDGTDG